MVLGGGRPWWWMHGVRRALIVVRVKCWWRRSGCREWNSCWAVILEVGGGWWSGGGLICTVFVLTDAVLFTGLGGCWWIFTLCIGGVVLFTDVTGRCWLFTDLAE